MQGLGEEGGADCGPSEPDPAADGGGDDGRATSPDAGAALSQAIAEPSIGDLVEIIGDGPHSEQLARVIRMHPDCLPTDQRKVWEVDVAHADDDMQEVVQVKTADLRIVEQAFKVGDRVAVKGGSGTQATVKNITEWAGVMVNFDGQDGDAIFRPYELQRVVLVDPGVAWPFPKKGAP